MTNLSNLESAHFHGFTSEILDVTSVRGSTVGNLMHHLTFFGAALGRLAHVMWRGHKYANLNCILVGTSGCGKGESLGIIEELYSFPEAHQELLAPTRHTSLTSGKRTVQTLQAILSSVGNGENRFLSIDEECSSLINSTGQGNNTLSQVLIKFIDGNTVTESCNGRTITIPPIHFGSIGHITPMMLHTTLRQLAFFSGFANRFLFMEVPASEFSGDDGSYSEEGMSYVREKLIESLEAGGTRTLVALEDGAKEVLFDLGQTLHHDPSSEKIHVLQQRMPDIILKLALTLALVNREATITRQTMEEARAIIDYSRATLDKLFGTPEKQTPERVILRYLQENGRTQRTPLMQALTGGSITRQRLDTALTSLISGKRVIRTTEVTRHGRRPEFFELAPAAQTV